MTRYVLAFLIVAIPAAARAQDGDSRTVQDIVDFLVTNQGVQTNDFDRDRAAADATRDTLTRALLSAVATVPVGSSSSGFVYRLNPELGTVERASETFGPFFVERALTSGRGQGSFGIALQAADFRSLDGNSLDDGTLVTTANQFVDEAEPFDVETLALEISTRTATIVGNVGVSDRVDIGAAVPIVRLDVNGSRVNTYRGRTLLQARGEAHTTGLGDIAVRTKVRLTPDGPGAAAAAAEVRLPTGREEDLLGTGKAALRLMGIASAEAGAANVIGNVAFGFGGLGREISYSGALAVAATPRFTLIGELLARRLEGLQRITPVTAPHPRIQNVTTRRLVPAGENETAVYAVTGFKWNVGATWLLHGHVLMPLTDHGLTTRITPTIALDYAFTR
ncbi:MAG: hypothetical protein AB7P99_05900 [Vicinamibacterales bacterium]